MWELHIMEYYSAKKKNEIMPFAATWMHLESPTEQKQVREEEILFDIPSLRTLRRNDTNELTEQKQTHWLPEQGYSYCREGWGVETGWDGHVHSTIFKTDNQQGPTVLYMELCSVLCGSLDGKGAWRRMGTYICMAESLCYAPQPITTLFVKQLYPNAK